MAYATSTMVKERMKISGTTRDAEISAAMTYGDARCDAAMSADGGSTPVSSPHQILKEAASDFAAYYMHRINNPDVATLFLESGKTMISSYIRKELRGGGSDVATKHGLHEV